MPKKEIDPAKQEVYAQIIKSVTAFLCVAATGLSLSSNVEKICKTNLETANTADGSVASSSGSSTAVQYSGTADYNDASAIQSDDAVYDDGANVYDNGANAYDINADGSVPSSPDAKNGTAKKTAEKYNGPLLSNGVIPFDFSKADPDPSKWTLQQIVDCYKSGMAKEDHDGVQTDMVFQLVGDLPGATSALKKPVNLAMKLGAQPYGALTGGYWDLQPSDLKRADAHKEGDYVVINLYPKEQVDGPNGKEHEGTVGHVVNVVEGIGDFIAYVEENFGILNAHYEDDSIVLKYPDAYAKNIKINTKTGKMESGTWGYDVEVYLDHCGLLGIEFNNFHTTIRWKCWYPVVD